MKADAARHPTRQHHARRCLLVLTIAIASAPAFADSVTDWNAVADARSVPFGGPPQRAYLIAMAQIAVHDALNSIDPRYESYSVLPLANPGASPDAAVAAAARDVLVSQLSRPGGVLADKLAAIAAINAQYAAALAAIADGNAKSWGIAAGQAAAAAIIQDRLNDGSATPNLPYVLAAGPGVYQSTPPNFPLAANAGWALLRPFGLISASQFFADPVEMLDITSAAYARDYNEVKEIGNSVVRNAAPDSEMSRIARFWANGGANWSAITRNIVDGRGLDRWQHARLFALVEMSDADGSITVFDTKYFYNFWRPVTAIRWPDDGNPATVSDAGWLPYQVTPPYPDFTCGLPTAAGASTEALRRYFGSDEIGFSRTAFGVTRSFTSLSQASAEAVEARVFAGIHFRTGCVHGLRHGEQVGRFVFQHHLRPLKAHN